MLCPINLCLFVFLPHVHLFCCWFRHLIDQMANGFGTNQQICSLLCWLGIIRKERTSTVHGFASFATKHIFTQVAVFEGLVWSPPDGIHKALFMLEWESDRRPVSIHVPSLHSVCVNIWFPRPNVMQIWAARHQISALFRTTAVRKYNYWVWLLLLQLLLLTCLY